MSNPDYPALLKQAIIEMRGLRSHISTLEQTLAKSGSEPIAIIGMACNFPNAPNLDTYWELLHNGHCAVKEVPPDRWNLDEYYDADASVAGKMYSRHGCFIESVDQFDASFFGISPREASVMDPQQRLLLETSYRAIENAGISIESLRGTKTGVYIGLCFDDYARSTVTSGDPTRIDAFSSLGNTRSIAAGRIAYVFGLQGTTMQLDTTCSSSLLAVHLAAQALRSGEIDAALVGGVNLMLSPEVTIGFCQLKALAVDGRSKAFDASADGYGRGEGCGMVLLKRQSDAVQDGDRILALIRGSAVNHDGTSNGLTAPNGQAQAAVIRQALTNAAVEPDDVQYVETHGTGTVLGDPIEVMALNQVFGSRSQPLTIGSVKANIGHLESAAGIAGLIKLILAMQQQTMPPQTNYAQPNPHIPWADLSIQVSPTAQPWNGQKLAGISSFGMSGTNVHLILEGVGLNQLFVPTDHAPKPPILGALNPTPPELGAGGRFGGDFALNLLCLSAKSKSALQDVIKDHLRYLKTESCLDSSTTLAAFCQACMKQRSHFSHRFSCVVENRQDAIEQLQQEQLDESQSTSGDSLSSEQIAMDILTWKSASVNDDRTLLKRLGFAYCQHMELSHETINWSQLQSAPQPRVILPEYPFQRQRHWVDRPNRSIQPSANTHPLLGSSIKLAQSPATYFEQTLSLKELSYLNDHQVSGRSILPTSAFFEMFWASLKSISSTTRYALEDFVIHYPVVLTESRLRLQTILTPCDHTTTISAKILSHDIPTDRWITHASATATVFDNTTSNLDRYAATDRCPNIFDVKDYYQQCATAGLVYGKQFQSLQELRQGHQCAIGEIAINAEDSHYVVHPILLDGCLQTIGAALPIEPQQKGTGYVPIGCDRVIHYGHNIPDTVWSIVHIESPESDNSQTLKANIQVIDATGKVLVEITGLKLQRLSLMSPSEFRISDVSPWHNWLYGVVWEKVSTVSVRAEAIDYHATYPDRIFYNAEDYANRETVNPADSVTDRINHFLRWIQPLLTTAASGREIVLITQGAVLLEPGDRLDSFGGVGLWGIAKTLRLEQPEWKIRCIDFDPRHPLDPQLQLLDFAYNQTELDSAFRLQANHPASATQYTPTLQSVDVLPTNAPQRLEIKQRGDLEQLIWQHFPRRSPNATEVEIRVLATGINFRDVLNALDLYPGEAGKLGCECVGEVVRRGKDVTQFEVGDRVIALATGSYSDYVTVDYRLAVMAPAHLSPIAAASIGVAFLTADYALGHLAKIKAGDRVLIHAAAGGVGQAAIQLARSIGAEIYATASPEKWDYVRSLNVEHVFNSRDLQFADDLLAASHGHKMDVVLNCLSGEFIARSMSLLKPEGCFLELGKMGVWDTDAIAQHYPQMCYHLIDLVALCREQPELIQTLLQALMPRFISTASQPQPLQPISTTVFLQAQAQQAFRLMQQGRHHGKLVIKMPPPPRSIRPDRSYLITGGTGGLGLAVAQLLVDEGATCIVLLSRHGASIAAQSQITAMHDHGVEVLVVQADGRDRAQIAAVLANLPRPLAGIIHAAGILADGLISQLTPDRVETVVDTKVQTAWHLHELTQSQTLDFFLLFSSATAIFGSPGQANHVAANASLDALAQYRHQMGLTALSINWGVWATIGSAIKAATPMTARGINPMQPNDCLQVLKLLLLQPPVTPTIAIMDIDWTQFRQQRDWGNLLSQIQVPIVPAIPSNTNRSTILETVIQNLKSGDQVSGTTAIEDYLKIQISRILGFQPAALETNVGFFDLGMDSLTAVELSSRLKTDLNCVIAATAAFDYPTIAKLAAYLTEQIASEIVLPDPEAPPRQSNASIDALSASEIASLLERELAEILQEKSL